MKGKGQYIYVHLAASRDSLNTDAEPVVKFNNGHFGGSDAVLFNETTRAHPKGVVVGMYEQTLKSLVAEATMAAQRPPSFIDTSFTTKVEYLAWVATNWPSPAKAA
uniref:Uncharacterized protein n=1 Tax=Haptolina brevifila TaxID=156173 RepID=A0A7S2CDF3_9EUKA|mmetsp:Transcript_23396/g.46743  ORF Transcript_23396/g.46743 Transcript_23396/m.46743 type:complete len:106 (+) Transcript_23396:284-601(+)